MLRPSIFTFDGAGAAVADADIVMLGVPYDGTASYRRGSAAAPAAIRRYSLLSQETYSPYQNRDLGDLAIADLGDLECTEISAETMLERVNQVCSGQLAKAKKMLLIGGEHLLTYAAVKAALTHYPTLHLLHIDAHADYADNLFGKHYSHGTVLRRCSEILARENIISMGVRSASQEEWEAYTQLKHAYPYSLHWSAELTAKLSRVPIYLSIDLDVLDPGELPGTGTPEAGGIRFTELLNLLAELRSLQVVAADVVELAPGIDRTGASTALAAKLCREVLLTLA